MDELLKDAAAKAEWLASLSPKDKALYDASIPQSAWESCYVAGDGMIFTPTPDYKTGEDTYKAWVTSQAG